MRYYRLMDETLGNRSVFSCKCDGSGSTLSAGAFMQCHLFVDPVPIALEYLQRGIVLDFSTDTYGAPVISERCCNALVDLISQDAQFLPAQIAGSPHKMFIVNALHAIDCVDEARSELMLDRHYLAGDLRHQRYAVIASIAFRPAMVIGRNMFRIKGYAPALIVSDRVRKIFEVERLSGGTFTEVEQ